MGQPKSLSNDYDNEILKKPIKIEKEFNLDMKI